ncbi:MAG: NFACT RNA binding domain-containing protein [Alkalibacterium sp.]|uniref:NFACT RNA binding domain-containing protein n=1 Tax=Alkalibacterium sp. TaxID=1872447 RepID=UPI0039707BE7
MSFDGLFVHGLRDELENEIIGGRITKIQQPYENEVILRIRANRKNKSLLLSAHPQYARVQLTDIPFDNPAQAPNYCMVLRKYLDGAIIESVEQKENDRILTFSFKRRNELGDTEYLALVVEIMGRHSNVLLVNNEENRLVDAIRHVPASQNTYRTLLPGATYIEAPSQDRKNPFDYDGPFPVSDLSFSDKVKWIQQTFQGFGKDSAQELAYRMDTHPDDAPKVVFQHFMAPFKTGELQPTLTKAEQKEFFSPLPYEHFKGETQSFDSLSDLMDRYYHNKAERDRVHQQSNDLSHLVKNLYQKNKKKVQKLKKELKETEKADDYRVKGEVLTAYLHEVNQGDESITLPNFYAEDEPLEISLNPQKSPAENAQYYFSRYQKLKSAKIHLTKQLKSTRHELNYFDTLLTQLSIASVSDIEDIRDELRDGEYLKKKRKKNRNKKSKKSQPEAFVSSDGVSILVGKNNTQNDELTLRKAHKKHWWAHAKDIPGSHVIIEDDDPSEQTLEEACTLAAYYSKYRLSASVPVDVVQVKRIKKPKGAKPGYVIYEGQTTYFVTPSDEKVRELKLNSK